MIIEFIIGLKLQKCEFYDEIQNNTISEFHMHDIKKQYHSYLIIIVWEPLWFKNIEVFSLEAWILEHQPQKKM